MRAGMAFGAQPFLISLPMPASARMLRAQSISSASTMMRRGRMPIEPSSTLMFWSATKQPMPASRISASTKEMMTASLVRISSFMPRNSQVAAAK